MSLPVDILVNEHKLILQAVDSVNRESEKIQTTKTLNPNFITIAVDFFRTYADRFHHGKEEGILFRELPQKKLSGADHKLLNELMQEHAVARQTVTAVEAAKEKYISGNNEALTRHLRIAGSTRKTISSAH